MTEKTTTSPLKDALCEFKKKKITIVKGKENPFFKSKYADLPEILQAVEGGLAELGIIISSSSGFTENGWELKTILTHKLSDEIVESSFPLFGSKPQEFGSSITYARRYNMQSLLNLAAEDDDGSASNTAKPMSRDDEIKKKANSIAKQLKESETIEVLDYVWSGFEKDLKEIESTSKTAHKALLNIYNSRGAEMVVNNA